MVLTEENQKLICEFENIIEQDEKMKEQLGRKNKIFQILRNNKNNVEKSLSSLEGYINNNNNNNNSITKTLGNTIKHSNSKTLKNKKI